MNGYQWALYTLIAFLVTSPLCLISNIKNLVWINFCAVIVTFSCLFIMVFYLVYDFTIGDTVADIPTSKITMLQELGTSSTFHYKIISLTNFVKFFGISVFSVEGVGMVLPIKNRMRNPEKFISLLFVIASITSLCTVIVSVLSYLVNYCSFLYKYLFQPL